MRKNFQFSKTKKLLKPHKKSFLLIVFKYSNFSSNINIDNFKFSNDYAHALQIYICRQGKKLSSKVFPFPIHVSKNSFLSTVFGMFIHARKK